MSNETTADDTYWFNDGNGFAYHCIGKPNPLIVKKMPCGHMGLLIKDRFVCQVCWSYEVVSHE